MAPQTGYAVADIAALKAIAATDRTDGYSRLVKIAADGKPAWYTFVDSSSATGDDSSVVVPNAGTGRWVRSNQPLNTTTNGGSSSSGADNILTGLLSFWQFEEASGIRNDVMGSNHLTPSGTITQVAGKVGNGAHISTGSYLSVEDNSPNLRILSNNSLTIAGWFKPDTLNATTLREIIQTEGYHIGITPANNLIFVVRASNGPEGYISLPIATANVWYFFVCEYNSSTNKISLQLNNNAETTGDCIADNSYVSGTFYIGCYNPDYYYFDGIVDALGVWNKVLTTEEKTYLYNEGNGVKLPTLVNAHQIQSRKVSNTTPTDEQALIWDNTALIWKPGFPKKLGFGNAPATTISTGTQGEIRVDDNYLYICVSQDTWKRVSLATW